MTENRTYELRHKIEAFRNNVQNPETEMDTIRDYIAEIDKIFQSGNATEHSYRLALQKLVENIDDTLVLTNEPKGRSKNKPDFSVAFKSRLLLQAGYIETKDISKDLDAAIYENQFERYKTALGHIIITDYLRFQFWNNCEKLADITIGKLHPADSRQRIVPLKENAVEFINTLKEFFRQHSQTIKNASELAAVMAKKTVLLTQSITKALNENTGTYADSALQNLVDMFRENLMPNVGNEEFADVYAQTIAYGLFVARYYHKSQQHFTRECASRNIPKSNPFLKQVFLEIADKNLDDRIAWIVDDLAAVFNAADMKKIMEDFGKTALTEDPVIHFYEEFLAKYNPEIRKDRGVYYTPLAVVDYIIRFIDEVLVEDFGMKDGLADNEKLPNTSTHKVHILDPATGTGTFMAEIVKYIYQRQKDKGLLGTWQQFVGEGLLPRLHGFEILMAPYSIAHLKLDVILENTGYQFQQDQRLGIYLTNSLDEAKDDTYRFPGIHWIVDEAKKANAVKYKAPVMVVVGNPPYKSESVNKIKWIEQLTGSYKFESDGRHLQERNPKWLNDDYVKFIRLAEHYIEKNQTGIIGYVNNHGYLDNPTFRGMRYRLMQVFDEIYIVNLHGNLRKKEITPDGSKDENLFDIQVGVCINLFIKTGKKKKGELAEVFYTDLWGLRQDKKNWLHRHRRKNSGYKKLNPNQPDYFFVPRDTKGKKKYDRGFSVADLFPVHSAGIITARNNLTVQFTNDELRRTIKDFAELSVEEARDKYKLGRDVRDWKVTDAQADLKDVYLDDKYIQKYHFRPLDFRWTYYTGNTCGFQCMPRHKVMQNIVGKENLVLVTSRTFPVNGGFSNVLITKQIIDFDCIYHSNVFPLWTYTETGGRQANLNDGIVKKFESIVGRQVKPEKVFDYIYAVLHSPSYRREYEEFLKIDFPKIPYPQSVDEFTMMSGFGKKLRELHLFDKLPKSKTTFPIAGNCKVAAVKYENNRVYINKTQYFGNVPETARDFYIGGYQPAQKYLKDRKGRILSPDEIAHYCKIITVLAETQQLMDEMG